MAEQLDGEEVVTPLPLWTALAGAALALGHDVEDDALGPAAEHGDGPEVRQAELHEDGAALDWALCPAPAPARVSGRKREVGDWLWLWVHRG